MHGHDQNLHPRHLTQHVGNHFQPASIGQAEIEQQQVGAKPSAGIGNADAGGQRRHDLEFLLELEAEALEHQVVIVDQQKPRPGAHTLLRPKRWCRILRPENGSLVGHLQSLGR